MGQILVRNLESEVIERLKERARRNGRSLQAEVALILREASHRPATRDARAIADKWQAHWRAQEKTFGDGAALIREDRER